MFRTRRTATKLRYSLRNFSSRPPSFMEKHFTFRNYVTFILLFVFHRPLFIIAKCLASPEFWKKKLFSGSISKDFKRHYETPRADWKTQIRQDGLYQDQGTLRWNERASIQISPKAEKELMEATFELQSMCLEVVDRVADDETLLEKLEIPKKLWPLIQKSWKEKQPDLLGRFDFSWNGEDPPKLLGYKTDAAAGLIESEEAQLNWQKEKRPGSYQCNFIAPAFINGVELLSNKYGVKLLNQTLGFCEATQGKKNQVITRYTINTVGSGQGIRPESSNSDQVQSEKLGGKRTPIIKLYPLDWLILKAYRPWIDSQELDQVNMIEPAWKLILSNKGLLPLLWEMYPNHPNLLPAFFRSPRREKCLKGKALEKEDWVSRPKYGLGGVQHGAAFSSFNQFENSSPKKSRFKTLQDDSKVLIGGYIYQQYRPEPYAHFREIQTNSWVISGQPAGLSFKEQYRDHSKFLPHYVQPKPSSREWTFSFSQSQQKLRRALYGQDFNEKLYEDLAPPLQIVQEFRGPRAGQLAALTDGDVLLEDSSSERENPLQKEVSWK